VKAGDNWRITRKLQKRAKNVNRALIGGRGSGYLLKILSLLEDACVVADAFSREEFENDKTNAENVNRLLLRSWILSCE
jgi:hypothetical protein